MNAYLAGALEQLETSWRAFEHNGKPMTRDEVRKALVYGLKKGYTSTKQLTDDDIYMALCDHKSWRSRISLGGGMNKICDYCGEFLGKS